jgi:hypothetical protein
LFAWTGTYDIRKTYSKLYYYFKPGKLYWIFWLFLRKLLLSVIALWFRVNPGFQLALALSVMFVGYVIQVKHRPYLSQSERVNVMVAHFNKVEEQDEKHVSHVFWKKITFYFFDLAHVLLWSYFSSFLLFIQVLLDKQLEVARAAKKRNEGRHKRRISSLAGLSNQSLAMSKQKELMEKKRTYFFDYNTIELFFLACSILVCLSGIMLDSKRYAALLDENTGPNLKAQLNLERDFITVLVLILIFGSFVYYLCVVMSEAFGVLPLYIAKFLVKKKNTQLAKTIDELYRQRDGLGEDDDIELQHNPYMAAMNSASKEELEELQKQTRIIFQEKSKIVEELRLANRNNASLNSKLGAKNNAKGKGRRGRGKKKKKEMAQTSLKTAEKKTSGTNIEMTKVTEGAAEGMASGQWKTHRDNKSGKDYYSNTDNGRVTWTHHDK